MDQQLKTTTLTIMDLYVIILDAYQMVHAYKACV